MYLGRTVEPVAVGSERRRPSGDWYSTFRPHNAGAPSTTLATGTPEHRLQGSDARSSVAVWHFTIVPSQRPPSFCRCSRATTIRSTTCRTCIVSCDADTFDDRGFAADGPGLWNWLPSQAKEADLSYNRFRRSLRHFCLDSEATEPLNYFNCAV